MIAPANGDDQGEHKPGGSRRKRKRVRKTRHERRKEAEEARRTPGEGIGEGQLLADGPKLRQDIGLSRMAIVDRWPTKPEKREQVMTRLCDTAIDEPNPEVWIPAARAVIAADRVNIAAREAEKQATGSDVNVNVTTSIGVTVVELAKKMLDDPNYLEYEDYRMLQADTVTGSIRANGEPGKVEDGPPPDGHQSGANGHRNGDAHAADN